MDNNLLGTANRRRIYLMRHGEVQYVKADGSRVDNVDLVDLTQNGQHQARTMAKVLADVKFDRALCSGLPRTRQTIAPILEGRDLQLEIYPEFREIEGGDEYGEAAPPGDLPERVYILDHAEDRRARWAGGEVIADFHARILNALETLLAEPGWSSMLLVAHGITNRAIMSWVTRGGLAGMGAYEQGTCCLNIFDADVVEAKVQRRFIRQINMTPENLTKQGRYQTSLEMGYDNWLALQADTGS